MRRSHRCDCGPENFAARSPHRHTRSKDDAAESMLAEAEVATGTRPLGCPWKALSDPFVSEVMRAHRWWKSGQLEARYAGRVPAFIVQAVEVFDSALNSVQVHDIREEQKQREEEAKRQERDARMSMRKR